MVTVEATSGTGERVKTATQTITVTVTDVSGEKPAAPAAPTVAAASVTSLTVTWSAPANAGPAITDYDVQYREGTSGSWTDGNHAGTAVTATLSGLSENTSHQVQVRATNDEGTGDWSDAGSGTTDANAAPSFSSSAAFDAAENQTSAGTVLAADSDSGDDITGYAITGGADQALFSIGATSGTLTFDAAPNFEDAEDQGTDNTYVVTVQATSGTGTREKTATQTITVTVTDVSGEKPAAPAAPTVAAASVTSLTVTWSAPANAGPAITDYDVQYREGTSGSWTDGNHAGTAVTATLSGLSENTSHQVQVRATNDEGTGDWSDAGSGTTDANAAPAFSSSAAFDAAENQTTAGTVLAADSDSGDDITGYAITGGADQALFSIGATSGALTFDAAPNFEDAEDQGTDNTYVVTVQATSGTGTREKTATQTITVTVTDVSGEKPAAPAAPTVAAASVTSLTVTWTAPANAGPAITDYDVQYREGTSGSWTDGNHAGTAVTATLSGLSENTSHQVQVRATNDEGTGDWSDAGSGTTDANAAPAFSSSAAFDAAENQTTAGTVLAADSDSGDDITGYAITGGADQALFSIGATSGALTFDAAPNFEDAKDSDTGNTYVVTVEATSGTGTREKTATQTITVTVTDVAGEAPGKPDAPDVAAASVTSLSVNWSAPDNAGPAITDYDYRHRTTSPQGTWTEVTGTTITGQSATIGSLAEDTSYDVQVRATNDEGTGSWSDAGSGTTDGDTGIAPPTVTSVAVASDPQSGNAYHWGEIIVFTVTFSEPVRVTGRPGLDVGLDNPAGTSGNTVQAGFWGLSESERPGRGARPVPVSQYVHFAYAVQPMDRDEDGVHIGADALRLGGGGRIQSEASGANAEFDHAAPGVQRGHRVDGRTTVDGEPAAPAAVAGIRFVDEKGGPLETLADGTRRLSVPEGGSARYGLRLKTRPAKRVVLSFHPQAGDADLDVPRNYSSDRSIAPDEWASKTVWVRVKAAQDADAANGERVFAHNTASNDPSYRHLDLPDVLVVEADDDEPGPLSLSVLDAQATEGALRFAPDETAMTVSVPILDDDAPDDGETFTLVLSNASFAPDQEPEEEPENTPAQGTPTLAGTPRVGETLTVSTSGITDADGLENATFAYQWLRDGADIPGATGASYTAVEADLGERLKVRVGFADDAGNEESLTSAATGKVAARPQPKISVADARVREAAGATLDFEVTLSAPAPGPVTVDYRTVDASAKAGADYAARQGTLTFRAGETMKTVSVTVLDDAHDEGREILVLTLDNARGGVLADRFGVGKIENADPLQRAWLSRFGRMAALQVVDHVEARLAARRKPGFRGRFAGRELRRGMERDIALSFLRRLGRTAAPGPIGGVAAPTGGVATSTDGIATPMGSDNPMGGVAALTGMRSGTQGGGSPPDGVGLDWGRLLRMGLGGGDVMTGSDFALDRETGLGGIVSVWSRGSMSRFTGQEGALSLGGDVRTTMFGADYAQGPLVAGLMLSHSRGLGEYAGVDAGLLRSSVTGLYPWLGYRATERISLWAVTGYGTGGLLLTPEGVAPLRSGLSMAMVASGARGALAGVAGGGGTGFGLSFKADALWVGTSIEGVDGPDGRLAAASSSVTRVRTALEGSGGFTFSSGLSLKPSVEVGLRHDGGDADAGSGLDLGGGLVVADASTGLVVDVRARTLLAHEAEGFSECGVSVQFSWNPSPSTPLGFTARVAPSWGVQATGGAEALWGRETMAGVGARGGPAPGSRLDAEMGYGLPLGGRFVGTPRVGVRTSASGRDYLLGYSLGVLGGGVLNLSLGVDAHRRESPARGAAEHGVAGRIGVRW